MTLNHKTQRENLLADMQNNALSTPEANVCMANAIIADIHYAQTFFNPRKNSRMEKLCNSLAISIKSSYGINITKEEIANIIFVEFYDFGRWSRLRSYRGEDGSIYKWIKTCGSQILYYTLLDLGIVRMSNKPLLSKTSLTILSMTHSDEREAVVNLVRDHKYNKILRLLFVRKFKDAEIMALLDMSPETYAETKKAAVKALKMQLLSTKTLLWRRADSSKIVNLVTLALSDTSRQLPLASPAESEMAADRIGAIDNNLDGASDLFIRYGDQLTVYGHMQEFVQAIALKAIPSPTSREVWLSRILDNEPPMSIANRLGIPRTQVDNKFSRARKRVLKTMSLWRSNCTN